MQKTHHLLFNLEEQQQPLINQLTHNVVREDVEGGDRYAYVVRRRSLTRLLVLSLGSIHFWMMSKFFLV